MRKNAYYILLALAIASPLFISSLVSADDSAVDDVTVSIPESCNLSTSSNQAYDIQLSNGQYKNDIGKTRLSVFCNASTSFAIYAIGYSDDTFGTTDMTTTTPGATNITTGSATSGPTSNWGMKIEAVTGSGTDVYTPTVLSPFNDFTSVPSAYAKIAEVASVTTGKTVEGAIDASYLVYISPSQPAGAYTGKVRYTVVHPASAPAPSTQLGLLDITNMQEMTAEVCDASTVGDEKQLIDSRDGKSYWVAKLADNKCWMTQNLDHDISTTFAYTPDNTDIPANWTPDKSTYPTSTTTWDTTTNGYNIQQSYDPGNKIWNGVTTSSSGTTINNMAQGTDQHYHLGNYYNWSAAVAMNNTSSYTASNTDVNQSICPKGWMLPKSGNITTAGSFQYLVNQYNWANSSMTNPRMWAAPLYFPLAGSWNGSSNYVAYLGYFWSSVVNSSSTAYIMYGSYDGYVDPAYNGNRYLGFSVRCVSR